MEALLEVNDKDLFHQESQGLQSGNTSKQYPGCPEEEKLRVLRVKSGFLKRLSPTF